MLIRESYPALYPLNDASRQSSSEARHTQHQPRFVDGVSTYDPPSGAIASSGRESAATASRAYVDVEKDQSPFYSGYSTAALTSEVTEQTSFDDLLAMPLHDRGATLHRSAAGHTPPRHPPSPNVPQPPPLGHDARQGASVQSPSRFVYPSTSELAREAAQMYLAFADTSLAHHEPLHSSDVPAATLAGGARDRSSEFPFPMSPITSTELFPASPCHPHDETTDECLEPPLTRS